LASDHLSVITYKESERGTTFEPYEFARLETTSSVLAKGIWVAGVIWWHDFGGTAIYSIASV